MEILKLKRTLMVLKAFVDSCKRATSESEKKCLFQNQAVGVNAVNNFCIKVAMYLKAMVNNDM